MPEREFSSPDGRRWRAWEVHPQDIVGERRRATDRRVTPVDELLDPPVLERRVHADRRATPTRSRASLLPAPWAGGWVVFEEQPAGDASAAPRREARRFAPIPADWTSCSERELARLLAHATVSRGHAEPS